MSEIGIEAIGVHLPDESLNCNELGADLDASPEFIATKLGFQQLCRKPTDQSTSDLALQSYEQLRSQANFKPADLDCLVVVTQNPDGGGIPHVSARLHQKLELPARVACFDISLGCSGFVHGLEVARGFMQISGMRRGLLFTADPYSCIIDPADRDTALLFGDASACTLLSDAPRLRVGKTCYETGSQFAEAIVVEQRGGALKMSGNQVFRYVARRVPKQIEQCLKANQCTLESIDLFLLHQGSKYIVDTLAANLKVDPERAPFAAGATGNSVSSSIPLLLEPLLKRDVGLPSRMLLSGFGVGLAAATTIVFANEGEQHPHEGVST